MSRIAVEFANVSMRFWAVRALRELSFSVRSGVVHALLGANGAGKSTLLKILCGLYPKGSYEGIVRVGGREVAMRSPDDALRQGIGYVPQEISVIESLTVAENIFVGRVGRGGGIWVSQADLNRRASALLEEHDIELRPSTLVEILSASQRQLVMIARALAVKPEVLILDEATACLTDHEAENLFRLVRGLRVRGQTTIFVTHRLREVEALADRVTVLRDGSLADEFDRSEINHDRMVTAMVGTYLSTGSLPPRPSVESTNPEVLRVEKLTVPHPRVARRNMVDGVSFHVRRGEILGIAGLVGAGRTEVLSAIYGRLPYTGKILIKGRETRIRSPRDAREHGIGLLTEERKKDGLLFNLPIYKNMTLASLSKVARLGLISESAEQQAAANLLERLAIRAPSSRVYPATLSGGNQQKVVLSRLLLAEPQVLLLDEPTKGVDVGAKAEIARLLFDLALRGMAIIVVSSELDELLALCDRLIVLSRGRVTDEMTRDQASETRIMLSATGHQEPMPHTAN